MVDKRESQQDGPGGGLNPESPDATRVMPQPRREARGTFPPGTLLSHTYQIERLLARGGMGEVYRARHVELGTQHAIKIILPELASNTKVIDLFRREASVLRTLRNDAVVGYDGVFRDENSRVYLVMEFVDGPSLSQVLKQGPLPPDQVRILRDRLATGLAAAHDKGVVHRDMSPDNVILPGGVLENAKIIDFGIAKIEDPGVKTILGDDFAGKYAFASPEQLGMFGGTIDHRSDIYSLGLVLAAAATGRPLDMGKSTISVVEARRAIPDLSAVPTELRDELALLLRPDPNDRPASMHDVIGAEPQPRPKSRPPGSEPKPVPPVPPIPSVTPRSRPPGLTAEPKARPQRRGRGVMALVVLMVLLLGAAVAAYVEHDRLAAMFPELTAEIDEQLARLGLRGGTTPDPAAELARIRATMDEVVGAFRCSALAASLANDRVIAIAGRVMTDQDLTRLRTDLAAIPGVVRVDAAVAVEPDPSCATPPPPPPPPPPTFDLAAMRTEVDHVVEGFRCAALSARLGDDRRVAVSGRVANQSDLERLQSDLAAITNVTGVDAAQVSIGPDPNCAPPPTPPTDLAGLRSEVSRIAGSFDCAGLNAALSDDFRVSVSGFVASQNDLSSLRTQLQGLPRVISIGEAVEIYPRPFCLVVPALPVAAPQDAPRIEANHANQAYRAGDTLIIRATATPRYDGYLYVDYIDSSGQVVHLLPNASQTDNRVRAGQPVVLGTEPSQRRPNEPVYVIGPPFGASMIMAISSPRPLFDGPRGAERIAGYLSALSSALRSQTPAGGGAGGTAPMASFTFLRLAP